MKSPTIRGVVMDKTTGESLNVFSAQEFTPETESGYVDVYFTVDVSSLGGHTMVVFEELVTDDDEGNPHIVAEHKDLNDEDQSIIVIEYVPDTPVEEDTPATPATPSTPSTPTTTVTEETPGTSIIQTGDDFNIVPVIVIIIVVILLIVLAIILMRRRPGNGAPDNNAGADADMNNENDDTDFVDDPMDPDALYARNARESRQKSADDSE